MKGLPTSEECPVAAAPAPASARPPDESHLRRDRRLHQRLPAPAVARPPDKIGHPSADRSPAGGAPSGRPPGEPCLPDPALLADPAGAFGAQRERGPVVRVVPQSPTGSRRRLRPLAALSGSSTYVQYAAAPPPCDRPHPTPLADPPRITGQPLGGRLTGTQPVWLVTRYDDVRDGRRDPRFVSGPDAVPGPTGEDPREVLVAVLGLPPAMRRPFLLSAPDTDPPAHTRLRAAVTGDFTGRRVRRSRPRIAEAAATPLDALPRGGPAELVEGHASPPATTVVRDLVGIRRRDRAAFRRWGDDILEMDPERPRTSSPELIDTVLRLPSERRAEPADDLLGALASEGPGPDEEPDGPADPDGRGDTGQTDRLSEEEAVAMTLNVVMAGYGDTARPFVSSLAALLTRPDRLAPPLADPDPLPGAVGEPVRCCGPDIVVRMRPAAQDADPHGVRIRKGDAVRFALVSAQPDPRRYPDPDVLDVTRQPADRTEGRSRLRPRRPRLPVPW